MKRIQIFAAALVGLLLLLFVGVSIYRLANPIPASDPAARSTPEVLPTPVAIDCPDDEVASYLAAQDSLMLRWEDAVTLADSTARIALSSPVANLQAIRQEAATLAAPPCAAHLQELKLLFMDYAIQGYLSFMQQSSDYLIGVIFGAYQRAHALHDASLAEFRTDPIAAYAKAQGSQATAVIDTFSVPSDWQTIRMASGEPWQFAIPPAWTNPPADDNDKILIKDPSGGIALTLYTKSNTTALVGKSMPIFAFLVGDTFGADGFQDPQISKFGENVGPLLTSVVADGSVARMVGAIEAPDATVFIFDADKTATPFTADEAQMIYQILASIQRGE